MSRGIAISTVAVHSGLYSLQQAAVLQSNLSARGASTITLFETGCDFRDENDVTHRNCTQACTQPAIVWKNPFTIHNCLVYSTVSGLIAKNNLTADGQRQAADLGYLPNFNLALIEDPANECMHSFCLNQRHADPSIHCSGASINTTYFSNATKGEVHNLLTDAFVQNACGSFKASPNVDVGGIGVYIGYLMQLSILIYCWIHGRLISSWLKSFTFVVCAPFGLKRARQRAHRVRMRLKQSHQGAALVSGLFEFQQAQSYFALTLNGAAIGALCSNGAMFDVQSLQQMRLTVDLLGDVAATAIICLTFGLYMLHAEGKRTWYVTFLSLIAILVSFATWILTCLPLRNLHQINPTGFELPACGNRSPAAFCLDQTRSKSITSGAVCIAICMLTTILMMVRQLKTHPFPSPRTSIASPPSLRRTSTHATTSSRARQLLQQQTAVVYGWRLEIAELILASMTIVMLVQLIMNGDMIAMREQVQWTFAQLIAVTIWAPSIIEYLYAAVRRWSLTGNKDVVERIGSLGRRVTVDEGVQVDFGGYAFDGREDESAADGDEAKGSRENIGDKRKVVEDTLSSMPAPEQMV
ncbi:uncharacterized protein MYCFIDRAFT_195814 [Pseudocercospora fijiensis CIRAD86]|uniref:Uncharacterized protein n=1 Tax=Pseudocercospora fijiensis (strain CIRAD86) TaxID=383855 RepID=M2Z502_PSEFD|nr:uncharacterized protein MYCFIDRAFT_195814 [Pseudocercospora fijiensis CIRAD86]EME84885.1 hypothetical protein MYCFIDRAFT_195814 [Pseudocercospora fijiensis CIRAD86]